MRGKAVSVGHHLFLAPVNRLAEAVHILEHGIVPRGFRLLALLKVLNQTAFDFLVERVEVYQLALFDFNDIQLLVVAATDCQLDIPLIAKDKLSLVAFRGNHIALSVVLGFLLKRNEVILPKLGRGGEIQAFPEQPSGKNASGFTGLKLRIDGYRRSDGGYKPLCPVRVAQRIVNQALIAFGGYCNAELWLLLRGLELCGITHSQNPHQLRIA